MLCCCQFFETGKLVGIPSKLKDLSDVSKVQFIILNKLTNLYGLGKRRDDVMLIKMFKVNDQKKKSYRITVEP